MEPLDGEDLRRRATGGAALMTARGGLIALLGLAGNLVLARLLVPRDFGLVAIGTALVLTGRLFAEGGVGAAFIRQEEPPERRDLEAVLGAQLAVSVALAAAFFAVGAQFGRAGLVPALVSVSLPLISLRLPATLMFERHLDYRPIATVDVVEAVAFYAWAIATVAAGLGVWGMASAFVVRAAIGALTMIRLSPLGFVRPRWDWSRVRPVLRFGVRFQAVSIGLLVRDQGLNVGLAALGGIATLGLWSFAFRILQIPSLLFASLWRVSYPAMSRILGAGEDPRRLLERGVGITGVATAAMLVPLAGSAPALVPSLAGNRWDAVPPVLLWGSLAIMIAAPVTVAVAGYLFAADVPERVLRTVVAQTVVWFAVTFALVDSLGVIAAGLGWIASSVVECAMLARATNELTGARVLARLAVPLAAAVPAGAGGWLLSSALPATLPVAVLAAAASEAVLVVLLFVLGRGLLRDTDRLVREAVRSSLSRSAGPS